MPESHTTVCSIKRVQQRVYASLARVFAASLRVFLLNGGRFEDFRPISPLLDISNSSLDTKNQKAVIFMGLSLPNGKHSSQLEATYILTLQM